MECCIQSPEWIQLRGATLTSVVSRAAACLACASMRSVIYGASNLHTLVHFIAISGLVVGLYSVQINSHGNHSTPCMTKRPNYLDNRKISFYPSTELEKLMMTLFWSWLLAVLLAYCNCYNKMRMAVKMDGRL